MQLDWPADDFHIYSSVATIAEDSIFRQICWRTMEWRTVEPGDL
jgi:hypothetical protein